MVEDCVSDVCCVGWLLSWIDCGLMILLLCCLLRFVLFFGVLMLICLLGFGVLGF